MDYLSVEDGIGLAGLRLVLTAGMPGPWGEAAKAIFHVKQIPYTPIRQTVAEESEALRRWTGQTGAPAAMYENERPRSGWLEILFLAERLEVKPPLIPHDQALRVLTLGLCHEICGEQGFGWSRRLMLLDPIMRNQPVDASNPLGWKYGYCEDAAAAAVDRVAAITEWLAARLRDQKSAGSKFLVGDALSAADLYWATFAAMLRPLPVEQCPMPEWMRPMYDLGNHRSKLSYDPILLEHRDFIYDRYLPLPMDF